MLKKLKIHLNNRKRVRDALQTLPTKIRNDLLNDVNHIANQRNPKNPRKPMNVSIGKDVWCVMYKRKGEFAALFYVVNNNRVYVLHIIGWHSSQKIKVDDLDIANASEAYRNIL